MLKINQEAVLKVKDSLCAISSEFNMENTYFMWISGESTPEFRTINDFRGSRIKGVIDEIFSAVLEHLISAGHVKKEHDFWMG
jgi:hypothetical protein